MLLRAAFAVSVLLIGLAGSAPPALAQFFPSAPQYLPPAMRPLPPVEIEDDEVPPYDPPPGYRQPGAPGTYALPPRGIEPPVQYGRGGQIYQRGQVYQGEVESNALPPPGIYREPPPGYEPIDPRFRTDRPNYSVAPPAQDDGLRPPMSIGPSEQGQQGQPGPQQPVYASLPPEERPELGPKKELPPQFRRTLVDYATKEPAGTIIIDTPNTYLYLVLGNGKAMRYGIGVGREGFTWSGAERVSRMAEWPDWHPPAEMIERQPYLPRFMAGGEGNPLGARALYLGKTLYRIHGTNQPSTIGSFVSSGCIRLTNEDVSDLYTRVQVGTRVVVLPGRPPATASAVPLTPQPQASDAPSGPYNPLAPPRR
jgi:lipoprotein-anchoring transpeptidase ErfK/SrfK